MKIAVLLKQVPDTETKIVIKADKSGIDEAGVKFVINPYDEFAIEEAIQKGTDTVVIAMGTDRVVESLRTALAMGIARAIHIDTQGQVFDAFQTATVFEKVLKAEGAELILCGKQAIDGDNSQVPQMIAELMNAGHVMVAEKIEVAGQDITVTRRVGGGAKEIYKTQLPLVVGCEKGLNTPRYASLPGIMKAKSKPIDKKSATEFLGGQSELVSFTNYELPPERSAGKVLQGDVGVQVSELVQLLRNEAKVV